MPHLRTACKRAEGVNLHAATIFTAMHHNLQNPCSTLTVPVEPLHFECILLVQYLRCHAAKFHGIPHMTMGLSPLCQYVTMYRVNISPGTGIYFARCTTYFSSLDNILSLTFQHFIAGHQRNASCYASFVAVLPMPTLVFSRICHLTGAGPSFTAGRNREDPRVCVAPPEVQHLRVQ